MPQRAFLSRQNGHCPTSTDLPGRGKQYELLRKRPGSRTEPPGWKKGSCTTPHRKDQEAKQNNQEGKRKDERFCHQNSAKRLQSDYRATRPLQKERATESKTATNGSRLPTNKAGLITRRHWAQRRPDTSSPWQLMAQGFLSLLVAAFFAAFLSLL
jgi:hypothetical protein